MDKFTSPALRIPALVLGLGLSAAGLFGLIAYVAGVIDIIINQPTDKSWLFWGLGLAGFGVLFLAAGVALLILWRNTKDSS